MIANDQELKVTQERIAHFQRLLAQIRHTARPEESRSHRCISAPKKGSVDKKQKSLDDF